VDELLDGLSGRWDLRGHMRGGELRHAVEGRWVLAGRYLELRTVALDGSGYEALYHLGYDARRDRYAFHLIDTTAVYARPQDVVGVGRRDGDAIAFRFGSVEEPFTNLLTRHRAEDAWSWHLSYVERSTTVVLAHKHMTHRRDLSS
jgi:hypothetical protein